MSDDTPYARITVADVYGQQRELAIQVQNSLIRQDSHREQIADHESRIRALESWRYALPISTLSAITAAAASIVGVFFS